MQMATPPDHFVVVLCEPFLNFLPNCHELQSIERPAGPALPGTNWYEKRRDATRGNVSDDVCGDETTSSQYSAGRTNGLPHHPSPGRYMRRH